MVSCPVRSLTCWRICFKRLISWRQRGQIGWSQAASFSLMACQERRRRCLKFRIGRADAF
jgi:hypothetical protein